MRRGRAEFSLVGMEPPLLLPALAIASVAPSSHAGRRAARMPCRLWQYPPDRQIHAPLVRGTNRDGGIRRDRVERLEIRSTELARRPPGDFDDTVALPTQPGAIGGTSRHDIEHLERLVVGLVEDQAGAVEQTAVCGRRYDRVLARADGL